MDEALLAGDRGALSESVERYSTSPSAARPSASTRAEAASSTAASGPAARFDSLSRRRPSAG